MNQTFAPLRPLEETALRRIARRSGKRELDIVQLRRLLQLQLIEWRGSSWRPTLLGRRHLNVTATKPDNVKPAA